LLIQQKIYTGLIGKIDPNWDFLFLSGLGNVYQVLGNYKEAVSVYKVCFTISTQQNDELRICQTLINLGSVFHALGDSDRALEVYTITYNNMI
jgi:tetratricopeptide (TPR) repeat protein